MKSFVLNNWSPALQAAFGDHWREHFQAKSQNTRSDDDSGASSSHVFEGLLRSPTLVEEAQCGEQQYGSPSCSEKDLASGAEQDFYLGRGGRIRTFETRSMEVSIHQPLQNCLLQQDSECQSKCVQIVNYLRVLQIKQGKLTRLVWQLCKSCTLG